MLQYLYTYFAIRKLRQPLLAYWCYKVEIFGRSKNGICIILHIKKYLLLFILIWVVTVVEKSRIRVE